MKTLVSEPVYDVSCLTCFPFCYAERLTVLHLEQKSRVCWHSSNQSVNLCASQSIVYHFCSADMS